MRWIALFLLPLGCAANLNTPGGETITVRGRVVDAETCASEAGCTGMVEMIVSLGADPEGVFSEPTASDGTFELRGVPVGYPQDLIVTGSDLAASVATTRNPMVIGRDQTEDVFGAEIYVLRRDPQSLLESIRNEGIDLVLAGGYIGQVVRVEESRVTAAEGVSAAVAPAPRSLRYVQVFPRFVAGEPALRPADATTTSAFGTFVVEPDGPTDPAAFLPVQVGWEYELVVSPLTPGIVTYAVHRGVPAI